MVDKNLSSPDSKKFWEDAETATRKVSVWPEWKKGKSVRPLADSVDSLKTRDKSKSRHEL